MDNGTITIGLTCLSLGFGACGAGELEERRSDVAEAGAMVMPFGLEATTHVFRAG